MKAVMIFSANDASVMMAESVAGRGSFSDMMNEKAKESEKLILILLIQMG